MRFLIRNKTYQPLITLHGRIKSRDVIYVKELDKQLQNLEKMGIIRIRKVK